MIKEKTILLTVDNNSPNFRQVNLIRVSKKTFKNPEDFRSCSAEFSKQLDKISGDKIGSTKLGFYLNKLLYLLFGKPIKFIYNLEGQNGFVSLNKSPEKDYHSFAVYTGDDALTMFNLLSKKNRKQNKKIINSAYSFEDYMKQFGDVRRLITPEDKDLCLVKYKAGQIKSCYKLLSDQSKYIFEDSDIHEFKLNSLEELNDLKCRLGFDCKK